MMTIKHITETGEEFVHPTSHVNFVPAHAKAAAPAKSSVWRYEADGRAVEIDEGRVYVMNDSGTTVARYDLTTINNPAIGRLTGGSIDPIGASPVAVKTAA